VEVEEVAAAVLVAAVEVVLKVPCNSFHLIY
jgi:hypothetical protein